MGKLKRYTSEEIKYFTDSGFWNDELTVDYWQRNAHVNPNGEAVFDGQVRFTWQEASENIDRLNVGLKNLGLRKGDVLLVQAQNSSWLMVLRLACEKAGIILTFLHYGFRRREIEHVIKTTIPIGAVISGNAEKFDFHRLYRDLQSEHDGLNILFKIDDLGPTDLPSVQQMIETSEIPQQPSATSKQKDFSAGNLTNIVTSSGTTGLPKCVEFSATPRLASGRVYIDRLKLTPQDKVVSFMPLYTGPADLLYHTAPQIGILQIVSGSFTPAAACQLIDIEQPSGMVLVPTMLSRMLNFQDLDNYEFSSLRFITCGGSILPYDVAKKAEQKFEAKIIQGYGLMDYGALASFGLDDPHEARWVSNGKPLDGTEIMILDQHEQQVNPGEIGEIVARGPHCVGGYIGDQDLTADVWKNGYFHTGDLGRIDADGYLHIHGRLKDIIIRGGQNISPAEIEGILVQHPKVADVVAVKMPDPDLGERVCVFIVSTSNESIEFDDMVQFMCDQGVAKFKIPERLELVDEFPLTPGGTKVDKKILEDLVS
jgi:non-ribosomal peptide synthetase component E (peptide arylation enzyme)